MYPILFPSADPISLRKVKTDSAVCPNCGAYYVYHTVCPTCGYYRGKLAVEVATAE